MKTRRFLIALYAVLLLLAAFPVQAHAAFGTGGEAYRVPTITVLAYHAPEDLEIRVEVEKKGERFPANTLRTISKECLTVGGHQDVMTLDCRSWTLSPGLPAWRAPLMVAIRVLLVLLVNALLFLVMGYREGRSWLCMLGVTLATQIPMNLILNHWLWVNETNWNSIIFVGLMFMCWLAIVFAVTMLLALLVQEHDRNRTGIFVGISTPLGIATLVSALIWLPV